MQNRQSTKRGRPSQAPLREFEVPAFGQRGGGRWRCCEPSPNVLVFSLADLEGLLGLQNLRQHIKNWLKPQQASHLEGLKGFFITARGVLGVLDHVKNPAAPTIQFPEGEVMMYSPPSSQEVVANAAKKARPKEKGGIELASIFDPMQIKALVKTCEELFEDGKESLEIPRSAFLRTRKEELTQALKQLETTRVRLVLVAKPCNGKSLIANRFVFAPDSEIFGNSASQYWGLKPLDTRQRGHRNMSVTKFNVEMLQSGSREFTVTLHTIRAWEGDALPTLPNGPVLTLNSVIKLHTCHDLQELDNYLGYLAGTDVHQIALRVVVEGPFDLDSRFVIVDTVGVVEGNSASTQRVRHEVSKADCVLVPSGVLLTSADIEFLDTKCGLFSDIMNTLPVVACLTKREEGQEDVEAVQAAQIYAASKDVSTVLPRFDLVLRLQLLGEIASRALVIHDEEALATAEARQELFDKLYKAVKARSSQSIVSGACGFLYALLLNGKTYGNVMSRFDNTVTTFKEDSTIQDFTKEELRELEDELRRTLNLHNLAPPLSNNPNEVDSELISSLRQRICNRAFNVVNRILEQQTQLAKTLAATQLESVCDLHHRTSSLNQQEKEFLHTFCLTELRRTTEQQKLIFISNASPVPRQLELMRLLAARLNDDVIKQIMGWVENKIGEANIHARWLAAYQSVRSSLVSALQQTDLPESVVKRATEQVTSWRKELMRCHEVRNAHLYEQNKMLKKVPHKDVDDAMVDLSGPEHVPLLNNLVNQVYERAEQTLAERAAAASEAAAEAEAQESSKAKPKRKRLEQPAPTPIERAHKPPDHLKVSHEVTKESNSLVTFQRHPATLSVKMCVSVDAHEKLRKIAAAMVAAPPDPASARAASAGAATERVRTVVPGTEALCIAVPTKFFDEDGQRLCNKRLDFECFSTGKRQQDHLVLLLVESAQLGAYREHLQKIEKACAPDKLNYIFVEIPDNSAFEVYFESSRLIATHYDIPYLARCPDNIDAMYEFRFDVVRLRSVAVGRAFIWTQRVLQQIEESLWNRAYELVCPRLQELLVLLSSWTEPKATRAVLSIGNCTVKGRSSQQLQDLLDTLNRGVQEKKEMEDNMRPLVEHLRKELPRCIEALDAFLVIAMTITAGNIYGLNFKHWPRYLRFLGPKGKAIQGPLIYRTDALRKLQFCTPQQFLQPMRIKEDLGFRRTRAEMYKEAGGLRAATWHDEGINTQQALAKLFYHMGKMQLQNTKMSFAPKLKYAKREAELSLMKRFDQPTIAVHTGFSTPIIETIEGDEVRTAKALTENQMRMHEPVHSAESLCFALLQALEETDSVALCARVAECVKCEWSKIVDATGELLFRTYDDALRWTQRNSQPASLRWDFAVCAAYAAKRGLIIYHIDPNGELTTTKYGHHDPFLCEPVRLAELGCSRMLWAHVESLVDDEISLNNDIPMYSDDAGTADEASCKL